MERNATQKKPSGNLPATRIISTDLDLKKSGLVRGNVLHRPRPSLLGQTSLTGQTSTVDSRRAEVQRRLREQEERRREELRDKLRHDEEKLEQLERRREELKRVMETRAKEKEAEAKTKRVNALKIAHDKFEDMMEKLHVKENRRLQSFDRLKGDKERNDRDTVTLETVVQNLKHRQKKNRIAEREEAAARQKRKKDTRLRQRATEALLERQQRIQDAVRDRDRAELQRLMNLPQPLLEARMPRYNFLEYPANRSMRRLLHQYKRKRIDEVTFNQQATVLARKMSPRRILLHQNQLLRDQQTLDRAAEGATGPGPVSVSNRPTSERTQLTWRAETPHRSEARHMAEELTDEAISRAGALFGRLLERSEVDLVALLDGGATQTFDDEGDLEASLSAFDFGGELELDAAAVERIEAMYRSQACRQRSEREARAFPSGELRAFSSALLDPGVSCSCTTLNGVDSQCSLCQLAAAKERTEEGRETPSVHPPPPPRRYQR